MKFLLDTCALSDVAKPRAPSGLTRFFAETDDRELALSALTIGEVRTGIEHLAPGARRERYQAWLNGEIVTRFDGRILAVDARVADRWGRLRTELQRKRRTAPIVDALIAATALVHGLAVVTRNVADFEPFGVSILDPWRQ